MQIRCLRRTSRARPAVAAISKEDAESNARLVEALFSDPAAALKMSKAEKAEKVERIFEAAAEVEKIAKDTGTPSHMQLDYDDDGNPQQLRFVYVDELECIGCTYCAQIARSTFFMEDFAGRARAFAQGQDEPDVVMEAIDSCPVNCISFVDLEDLTILETERDGVTIDHRSIGMSGDGFARSRQAETKAKLTGGLMCCNNCPSRGCKDCPMYGVGLNPAYMARVEEQRERKEASGEAQRKRDDADKAAKVGAIFGGDDSLRRPWQVGDRALVPAAVYADYPCEEQAGLGWLVELLWVGQADGQSTARVKFIEAEGYADLDLATSCLEAVPLRSASASQEGRSAEECITESVTVQELVDCASDDDAVQPPDVSDEQQRERKLQALYAEPDLDDMIGEDIWSP